MFVNKTGQVRSDGSKQERKVLSVVGGEWVK